MGIANFLFFIFCCFFFSLNFLLKKKSSQLESLFLEEIILIPTTTLYSVFYNCIIKILPIIGSWNKVVFVETLKPDVSPLLTYLKGKRMFKVYNVAKLEGTLRTCFCRILLDFWHCGTFMNFSSFALGASQKKVLKVHSDVKKYF